VQIPANWRGGTINWKWREKGKSCLRGGKSGDQGLHSAEERVEANKGAFFWEISFRNNPFSDFNNQEEEK